MYAATPPLECLRTAVSFVMGSIAVLLGVDDAMKLMVCDVSWAYFPAICQVCVTIVDDDFWPDGEGKCGRLNASMYGTRDAILNWYEHCR